MLYYLIEYKKISIKKKYKVVGGIEVVYGWWITL